MLKMNAVLLDWRSKRTAHEHVATALLVCDIFIFRLLPAEH